MFCAIRFAPPPNLSGNGRIWEERRGRRRISVALYTEFSHGICPECMIERYPEFAGKLA